MRLRVGHRHRRLVRERLQHLEVLAGVGGVGALAAQHQQAAQARLEAEWHHHLRAHSLVGVERGAPGGTEARVRRQLVARERAGRQREGVHDRGGQAVHQEACRAHVHRRLDGGGEPSGDLVQIEQARHRAGQRPHGLDVVGPLAEEGAVHRPAHPLPQRVEQQRDQEHEAGREPRRAREIGLGQERVGRREQQRIGAGDQPGQPGIDHRAADHHGGVEQAVAHGGVGDRGRVEQHERRAHLRVHRPLVDERQRPQHEGEPAPEAEADAEQQHAGLLVHQRRDRAAPGVEERRDLDRERDRGQRELQRERARVEPAGREPLRGEQVDRPEQGREGDSQREGGAVEHGNDPVALEPRLARGIHRMGEEQDPAVDREERGNEAHQRRAVFVGAQGGVGHRHVRHRPQAHVEEEAAIGRGERILSVHRHAHREHDDGDQEVAAEAPQQRGPREGHPREIDREPAPVALDLVVERAGGRPHARHQADRRAAVDRHEPVAPAQARRARGGLRGGHVVIDGEEEAGVGSADLGREAHRETDHDREAQPGDERVSAIPARHARARSYTLYSDP